MLRKREGVSYSKKKESNQRKRKNLTSITDPRIRHSLAPTLFLMERHTPKLSRQGEGSFNTTYLSNKKTFYISISIFFSLF